MGCLQRPMGPGESSSIYPRYDGPYHVLLRDEPRPGHIWVSQPEEIDIDYTDGGPPKLHEWQMPEGDVDASHIELPWRIPRCVLELSGAHEAEQRGDFACRRLDRSSLPPPCRHCYHIESCCNPRCHPPYPHASTRMAVGLTWGSMGLSWVGAYCSEQCAKPNTWDDSCKAWSRCLTCEQFRIWREANHGSLRPSIERWKALYDTGGWPCRCCSSSSTAVKAAQWAYNVCSEDWHHARMHKTDDLWYLDERRSDACVALQIARGVTKAACAQRSEEVEDCPCTPRAVGSHDVRWTQDHGAPARGVLIGLFD